MGTTETQKPSIAPSRMISKIKINTSFSTVIVGLLPPRIDQIKDYIDVFTIAILSNVQKASAITINNFDSNTMLLLKENIQCGFDNLDVIDEVELQVYFQVEHELICENSCVDTMNEGYSLSVEDTANDLEESIADGSLLSSIVQIAAENGMECFENIAILGGSLREYSSLVDWVTATPTEAPTRQPFEVDIFPIPSVSPSSKPTWRPSQPRPSTTPTFFLPSAHPTWPTQPPSKEDVSCNIFTTIFQNFFR